MLKTQSVSRLVGANSPGIISSVGKCRIGFQPLPCFEPGEVGIVAKSGTLSYETAASTLRAGLGQSLCIGVGGDIVSGTGLVDGLTILAEDESTEAIAICGEIGGFAEMEAAEWIQQYRTSTRNPNCRRRCDQPPFTIRTGAQDALERISKPEQDRDWLKRAGTVAAAANSPHPRRQAFLFRPGRQNLPPRRVSAESRRNLCLDRDVALDLLRRQGLSVPKTPGKVPDSAQRLLAVSINRDTSSLCIIASPTTSATDPAAKRFDLDYTFDEDKSIIDAEPSLWFIRFEIAKALGLETWSDENAHSLFELLYQLAVLFRSKEAFLFQTHISVNDQGTVQIVHAHLGFDDAALRSGKRQTKIHKLRDTRLEDPAEVAAEPDGIVYIKLGGDVPGSDESHNIGTLVNGAGLAMNTVDALADAGGKAANFLDTGGKATSETVKRSFEIILRDKRVKCIFVNIFGGLTLGDMIARGIVLAFRDLETQLATIPVVVRIRGTNEAEGQRIIADSGLLGLHAFEDFDEAAAEAVELANRRT
ncbi:succinyl-CoA ligase subunit alpha [Apiospora saccharicola]